MVFFPRVVAPFALALAAFACTGTRVPVAMAETNQPAPEGERPFGFIDRLFNGSERLSGDPEWVNAGDRWILKSLLPDVNTGHRNLAEAILMLAGEPLPADRILKDLDVDKSAPLAARTLAVDLVLSGDKRFRNVGAIEAPLWTLATLG